MFSSLREYIKDFLFKRKLIYIDELTGVWNRRKLYQIDWTKYHYLIFIDVNDLGKINKERGFIEGDKILCNVVSMFHGAYHYFDVFRIGGDEFVILAKENDLKLINKCLNLSRIYNYATYTVIPIDKHPLDTLIQKASLECYAKKASLSQGENNE